MNMDFNRIHNRKNTNSYKWDQIGKLFGSEDILPLWVADMDFESPPAVKEAVQRRAAHGIYGYTFKPESYTNAIIGWFARRHNWELKSDWLSDSPSVVTSLSLAVDLLSEPGSKVILQSPVYYPFYDVIRNNGREIVKNPLILRNGQYEMDYEHLETVMKDGARLLLLCNPHNPGGRVWSREELLKLGELCLRYGVTVVSDEIHCDLVLSGHRYTPFASLSPEIADITLTCLAPTKTFNMPGLQISFIAASNKRIKKLFDARIKTLSLHMTGYFAPDAVVAAYEHGDAWLDELLQYVQGNVEYAQQYFHEHLPAIDVIRPQGTYLMWFDCSSLGLSVDELKQLMYQEAKVAFNEGSTFGSEGAGFLRINLACPRSILHEALERFCTAAQKHIQQ
jgi:cystathionine beta-lyase